MNKLPRWLKPFFWDVPVEKLDLQEHRIFIIERLLNEGNQHSLQWLFRAYSEGTIREAVTSSRGLTLKTARCWQNYFGLKEEEMRCFGIFSANPGRPY